MAGTSDLWRSWIEERRQPSSTLHAGSLLRELRVQRGLTQQQLASRLEITQPEVSRLERRRDVRVSTASSYVQALGGRLVLSADFGIADDAVE